ncbi:MAG TPA: Nif3-like dinuclear metal center hexameric protein [Candidatus Cryosericum sp.]|nr:Nif3-like dinuclear metal center hexameric protein [Candidatus Cryosericum sp.]
MHVHDLYDLVDVVAPFRFQEDYDNAGLVVGAQEDEVRGALLCLDLTHETVEEAGTLGANLIVCHHPPIFKPLKKLDPTRNGALMAAIRMDVDVLAAHTNFDAAPHGLNAYVVEQMGLTDVRMLEVKEQRHWFKIVTFVPAEFRDGVLDAMFRAGAGQVGLYSRTSFRVGGTGAFIPEAGTHPHVGSQHTLTEVPEDRVETIATDQCLAAVLDALRHAHPYEEPVIDVFEEHVPTVPSRGMGHVGNLSEALSRETFVSFIKSFFKVGVLPVAGTLPATVGRVAFCSGSGSSLVSAAVEAGAQVLITGDVTYHTALDTAQTGACIAIVDHYSSEHFFGAAMERALRAEAGDTDLPPLYQSAADYQPVRYF